MKVLINSDVYHFFTLDFPDPDYIGRSLKPNIDTLTDGNSDYLLSVDVKILLNCEGLIVQNLHKNQAFYM